MRNLLLSFSFLAVLGGFVPSAQAAQFWPFGWWPGHWDWVYAKDFNGYLGRGKEAQNQQWRAEDWYVQDWVSQYANEFQLIDGFYRADILREQDDDGGVAVLMVGPNFYRLGGFDKRRVLTTLDAVYKITDRGEQPVILLKDWNTKKQIGVFTKEGLTLE